MQFRTLTGALAALFMASAAPLDLDLNPVQSSSSCSCDSRLAGAQLIISSYNDPNLTASAAGFQKLPLESNCTTYINPNGGPAVPVAVDAGTTKSFATATRLVFSEVTGVFDDYDNGTTIIHTNVTLGALGVLAIPVTFYADVHLEYNLDTCLMQKIQAFATIPTRVAGIEISPPIIDVLKNCSPLYTGILG